MVKIISVYLVGNLLALSWTVDTNDSEPRKIVKNFHKGKKESTIYIEEEEKKKRKTIMTCSK